MGPVQIKMARAALGLSLDDLAHKAAVDAVALRAVEDGETSDTRVVQSLHLFFSAHGIELIEDDGVRINTSGTRESVTVDELTTGNDGGQG